MWPPGVKDVPSRLCSRARLTPDTAPQQSRAVKPKQTTNLAMVVLQLDMTVYKSAEPLDHCGTRTLADVVSFCSMLSSTPRHPMQSDNELAPYSSFELRTQHQKASPGT